MIVVWLLFFKENWFSCIFMTMDHSNNDWRHGLARIELRVSEIGEWMIQKMWKLNDDKTELIVFTSKYKQDLYNDLSITIGGTVWIVVHKLETWGSYLIECYRYVSMCPIPKKTCRFHIRNICRIRKYLLQDTSVVLVQLLFATTRSVKVPVVEVAKRTN